MATKIWYQDIQDFLLNPKTIIEVIPDKTMSFERQLNAIIRFSLYFSIVVYVIKRDYKVFYFFVIIAVFSYGLYYNKSVVINEKRELFDKLNLGELPGEQKPSIQPSSDNPFMNVSVADLQECPNRPPAANILNKDIQEKIQDIFEEKSMINVDDIFHKNTGFNNFYTMPNTQVPNDRSSFQNWLYQSGPTCKERNFNC